MKAIILKDFGGTDQLSYEEVQQPLLKAGEVLIQSKAISINPVDIKTRKGKGQAARLKNDQPMILGWDVSGVIVDAAGSSQFKVGDEVFGMIYIPGHGKCYAQYVAAPVAHITLKPASISHVAAAATCLAAMTAWQALVEHAQLKRNQTILIHAAAGGVGHFAVQIAKHIGAFVIGTSSAANRDFVLSTGANEHVDYKDEQMLSKIEPVDVVLDAMGGDNIKRSLQLLKKGGTIISLPSGVSETVGEQAASEGKKGIFFFVQSRASDMTQLAALLERGIIKPHVSKTFSFEQIKEAHDHVEAGHTVGKVVVEIFKI